MTPINHLVNARKVRQSKNYKKAIERYKSFHDLLAGSELTLTLDNTGECSVDVPATLKEKRALAKSLAVVAIDKEILTVKELRPKFLFIPRINNLVIQRHELQGL